MGLGAPGEEPDWVTPTACDEWWLVQLGRLVAIPNRCGPRLAEAHADLHQPCRSAWRRLLRGPGLQKTACLTVCPGKAGQVAPLFRARPCLLCCVCVCTAVVHMWPCVRRLCVPMCPWTTCCVPSRRRRVDRVEQVVSL